jgi:hypothetical protein
VIEAGIRQGQGQGVLPVNPSPDGIGGLTQAVWREKDPEVMARNRRGQAALAARAARRSPTWIVEPSFPLARLAPTETGGDELVVYVAADAALPPDRRRQARTWVEGVRTECPPARRVCQTLPL